jgi:luciferase family oxidoreductase group 1
MKTKKVAYSILELALISAGSGTKETFDNSLDLARKAESLGYTRFWFAEHHNMLHVASSATVLLIGHVAAGTSSIRVGSGGIMLPNHSPLIVAEQFGTLGALYPNRIDLGLGRAPGTDQLTARAIRSDRMQAVHDFPKEIQAIQQYFSPDNDRAAVRATVAEGVDVPIYILGSSTDSAYLAAHLGLPYAFASHFATGQLFEALAIYRREFRPSALLSAPYVIAGVNVIAADTEEEATRNFTTLIRMFWGVATGRSDYMQPPTEMTDELRYVLNSPAITNMLKYSFVGDKQSVAQQLDAFLEETGADEIMAVSSFYGHEDRVRSYSILAEIMKER